MFDVGFAELFLLALIGLLVLGPERLPGVARKIGGFVRKARTSWITLRNTIEKELAENDPASPIRQAREQLNEIGRTFSDIPGFTPENRMSDPPEASPGSEPPAKKETNSQDDA